MAERVLEIRYDRDPEKGNSLFIKAHPQLVGVVSDGETVLKSGNWKNSEGKSVKFYGKNTDNGIEKFMKDNGFVDNVGGTLFEGNSGINLGILRIDGVEEGVNIEASYLVAEEDSVDKLKQFKSAVKSIWCNFISKTRLSAVIEVAEL
jgi:hypothetical protein